MPGPTTIDVDVGGTFTDLVMVHNGRWIFKKVPTTPYDLSVCFLQAIEEAAKEVGTNAAALLPQVGMIRYSTTVAMNRLLERKGPRIGLITTEGHEDAILIGRGAQWIDGTRLEERRSLPLHHKPEPLVPRRQIVGVKERIDSRGRVVRPLAEEDVRRKVRTLVDRGVRAFVVSLLWSFVNPAHERRIKEIIREEYPDDHIGSMPVILSSDVIARQGEYERTMTAILDAYLQRSMQFELSGTWDKLREQRYRGPFLMVHNTGGCADVFKTTAGRTYNGGPVAGIVGARELAQHMGMPNVVLADMGGTSFDIGLVVNQSVRNYEFHPVVDRWRVGITMLQSLSIGAGGGSIAWVNHELGCRLEVGPQGAGSYPGPACYNLGGTEPTVTDADLLLGYLNPDRFFNGRMKIHEHAARRAIERKIAKPLGLDVIEAAALIRRVVDEKMASAIRKEVHLRGYRSSEFVLFAVGGAGPTHVAGFRGDIPVAVMFPFSPVFCAYGSSTMDIVHLYERSHRMQLIEPRTQAPTTDYERFNRIVNEMLFEAKRELAAEGLSLDDAVFHLELDMFYGGQIHSKRAASPLLSIHNSEDVWRIYRQFEAEFADAFSPLVVHLPGGVYIDSFILRASVPGRKRPLEPRPLMGEDAGAARVGSRPAYWPEVDDWRDTPVYAFEALKPGNRLEGPALIESPYTTAVVPPGCEFRIDTHGLGIWTFQETEKGGMDRADSHRG